MLKVHSIETFGTHEGPGIRLVVFLQGCHFRCVYCHNPDTWDLKGGQSLSVEKVLTYLDSEMPYFKKKGGLTVSGGEPLVQRKELTKLFKAAKLRGVHTALDTNGYIFDNDTKKLLEYTDLVLLDVKHINPLMHRVVTGMNNSPTLQFAAYLKEIKKPVWLRYVLVPGFTDQIRYLHEWGEAFTGYENVERVEILPYHTYGVYKYKEMGINYKLAGVNPPNTKQIDTASEIFKQYFSSVYVR